ncbi:HVA22-like protein i [Gastrolobium bilobum]|uniref:HVA22-like protein i n=1 Tax=Gastrolobium bilobum TaxID=150636 RepID=UPI002AAFBC39|nr:HVA22-like protein i [Gastrolobium bilobum]
MMGSFVSKALLLVFGYSLPAYECFKTVDKSKPEIERLVFWCQYWIVVAFLTVVGGLGDTFISWVPLYNEAKLAFFVYLWYSKTEGSIHLYSSFIRPYMVKHEKEINDSLSELRVKATDIVGFAWRKAVIYGINGFTGILNQFPSLVVQPRINQVHMDKQGSP